jgi:drug/metabolite transporter (DMT)-like permease
VMLGSTIAYVLCAAVSAACAALLFRTWKRKGSRLIWWTAIAFAFLTVSNLFLIMDSSTGTDSSLIRPVLVALGLGVLVYGLTLEEQ